MLMIDRERDNMGLAISRWGYPHDIRWHYGAMHYIRFAACRVAGYEGEWEEFDATGEREGKDGKYCWDLYPDFWQLLHFSDCEGLFVPGAYLDSVDMDKQFELGNYDKLRSEVIELHSKLSGNEELLASINVSAGRNVMDYVQELFNMLAPDDCQVGGQWVNNYVIFH